MNDEKIIEIDVNLTRGLVAVLVVGLLALALLGYLVLGHEVAAASGLQDMAAGSADMRQYYLTNTLSNGANADTACISGYHFASLWEIMDTSNLKYNSDLGYTREDSGQGPPSQVNGWVRTGYNNGESSTTPGEANCRIWSSSSNPYRGTYAYLVYDWDAGGGIGPWQFDTYPCTVNTVVWCVED